MTVRALLVSAMLALPARGGPAPAAKVVGWSTRAPDKAVLLTGIPAGSCTEVDAYTGTCVAN
jgi:hypothetical protein